MPESSFIERATPQTQANSFLSHSLALSTHQGPHTRSCTSAWMSKHCLHPTQAAITWSYLRPKIVYNSSVISPHEERPGEEACTHLEKQLKAMWAGNSSILIPRLWSRKQVDRGSRWACPRDTANFSLHRKRSNSRRARAGLSRSQKQGTFYPGMREFLLNVQDLYEENYNI